ncbi:hypothetical protein ACYE2N_05625 [Flavobacterium sp. MAHUQ-51]|uniref:hypothetical protein n=1 Tax=Flavobacterium sp. GCM10022190 TaxID=3252639 RepID=UPI0036137149
MKYLLITLFSFTISFAQSPKRMVKKIGTNPIFFIDSISVEKEDLQKYNPNEISSVTVYKDKNAYDLLGEDGKDGVVYIETKKFCKNRYWKYFTSKSTEYQNLVNSTDDNNVQYIINDRVLNENFEGDLAAIDDKVFKSIKFISKELLLKEYKIEDKDFGFQIISDTPKDLYHGNKKF